MGCCTTTSGVGQVSLQHIPSGGMHWVGLEMGNPAAITQGATSAPLTHIVYIESSHLVDIEVASADTILIHNHNTVALAGNLTLVW
jgi:hypothetical protein